MPKESEKKTKSAPNRRTWELGALGCAVVVSAVTAFALSTSKNTDVENIRQTCAIRVPAQNTASSQPDSARPTECVRLEQAVTREQQIQGLSGREVLPYNRGMLFVFESAGLECIWMKDMNFALDILWLNKTGEITKIEPEVEPDTYPEQFCADNTKYVIELNAGTSEATGLEVGDTVKLEQ